MLLTALILLAAPATDSATCGVTKFTLAKPVQAAPKPKAEPAPKPKTEVAKAKPKPKTEVAKAKPKPLADCDKPKKG